ncbi:hypothetical protein KL921_002637 [Ogataea angusta]|uniref:Uncharacterized protein n=1 Tax=Pichia angusta TaxID=870730 RepID=A0AAN6DHI0_PICAN|nr:uncharacterized protein KL928_001650 [Ogataea angusta]KAG7811009.1 hypothetical protein KL921_002637 [Ogataea angusta]KAG7820213.1 hypothetical protein KL928_001650 [Ogataea angusta]KAG7823896.1 hypothetical protein KL909_002633 [Ogataea angusta]KAG7838449.1 hypothetical protein KL943_000525 [Ogataea angusta]KAG7840866.1 hypothetical protein KL942_001854 [Ogataea angusta]
MSLSGIGQFANRHLVKTIKYAAQPQLYVHKAGSTALLSFSSNPTRLPIGKVKAIDNLGSDYQVTPDNFVENKSFIERLQSVIKGHVADDMMYRLDSLNYRGSYMPIYDLKRVPEYMNQQVNVDNVLGYIKVDAMGNMDESTYQANNTYRLCNADGIIKLSDVILEELKKQL